ncbi:MAG: type II toxin-antitoxin system HigB family toxin [Flavobacteriaceae bacterium]
MRVLSKRTLRLFWEQYPDSVQQLLVWYREMLKASWGSPNELKLTFANVSIVKNNRVVFNICGNKYRLVVEINYQRKWLFIRFIGTHKDYDNIDVNTI